MCSFLQDERHKLPFKDLLELFMTMSCRFMAPINILSHSEVNNARGLIMTHATQ